ncbi:MAG: hypothetical protein IKZ84_12105 [Victivallales bacterium]|nr:hypothetical protein [Victivallales bacterium]
MGEVNAKGVNVTHGNAIKYTEPRSGGRNFLCICQPFYYVRKKHANRKHIHRFFDKRQENSQSIYQGFGRIGG